MEKNIKDYLHLYIGCKALLMDYDSATGAPKEFKLTVYNLNYYHEWFTDIKPILRPLSDMTEGESEFISDAALQGKPTIYVDAEVTAFLLSKHFDLFGLIEAGLAIDKTSLKPTT